MYLKCLGISSWRWKQWVDFWLGALINWMHVKRNALCWCCADVVLSLFFFFLLWPSLVVPQSLCVLLLPLWPETYGSLFLPGKIKKNAFKVKGEGHPKILVIIVIITHNLNSCCKKKNKVSIHLAWCNPSLRKPWEPRLIWKDVICTLDHNLDVSLDWKSYTFDSVCHDFESQS